MHLFKKLISCVLAISLTNAPATAVNFNPQVDCMARTILHEAGGESVLGQKAVGATILNRTKSKRYPSTICGVVRQRGQFRGLNLHKPIAPKRYQTIYSIALKTIEEYNLGRDPSNGAVSFHSIHVKPRWKMLKTASIGSHLFYR